MQTAGSGIAISEQRLTRTLEAARLLQSTLDLEQLTSIILEIVRNEIPVDRVTAFVVDRERKNVNSLVAQGVGDFKITLPMGSGIAGFVAETGQAQDILDVYADARFNQDFDRLLGYRTNDMLAWPIHDQAGSVTGVIELLNRKRPIAEEDLEFLGDISGFIALALENSFLHEEARQKVRLEEELSLSRERLVQMDRLVLISEVLSTIETEMGAPLLAIQKQIELLRQDDDATTAILNYAKVIELAAGRSHETVRGFLDFVRKQKDTRAPLDLGPLIRETIALRSFHWGVNGISVESNLEEVPTVQGNAAEIQHALTNIIKNAEDAVSANTGEKRLTIRLHTNQNRRKVQIDVEDNGNGIAVQLYERIFEPFFSAKHDTARPGLGLTIASRIVQEHGGEILFQTTVGEGSVFTLELPA